MFSGLLPQLRKEFVFKKRISYLVKKMLPQIRRSEKGKNLIFVGIHARHGDRIQVWNQRKMFRDTIVGTYEGKFFNYAMDIFRSRYNNNEQKVVFLPTSDDYFWIKKHLINKRDVYFSREIIKETCVALPSKNEILQLWNHENLAVKGFIYIMFNNL